MRARQGGTAMSFTITPRELKDRLDKGDHIFILDVREPWEYSMAKIEGAVLIPLGNLPQSLDKLDRNVEIVAHCHHGMRSADAAGFLLLQGLRKVTNSVGAMSARWLKIDPTAP